MQVHILNLNKKTSLYIQQRNLKKSILLIGIIYASKYVYVYVSKTFYFLCLGVQPSCMPMYAYAISPALILIFLREHTELSKKAQ